MTMVAVCAARLGADVAITLNWMYLAPTLIGSRHRNITDTADIRCNRAFLGLGNDVFAGLGRESDSIENLRYSFRWYRFSFFWCWVP